MNYSFVSRISSTSVKERAWLKIWLFNFFCKCIDLAIENNCPNGICKLAAFYSLHNILKRKFRLTWNICSFISLSIATMLATGKIKCCSLLSWKTSWIQERSRWVNSVIKSEIPTTKSSFTNMLIWKVSLIKFCGKIK